MIELKVAEIRVSTDESPPVVVLEDESGQRRLPIWMSHGGAAAILAATEEPDERRPALHDLVGALLGPDGADRLSAVRIISFEDGQFFAELELDTGIVSARPSDAIALALRVGCPIQCPDAVFAECGISTEATVAGGGTDEVERFLEFLDSVNPEDFTGGQEQP